MQRYEMGPGILRIIDSELGLDITDRFDQDKLVIHREDTKGRMRVFHASLDEALHGPSLFYSEAGVLLSSSWFCRGLRQGELRRYYTTGALYAIQSFAHGKYSGRQLYYYPDGKMRTKMFYKEECLEGEMTLFWPNGQMKRQLFFVQGKKSGLERFWDEQGGLVEEISHDS